MFGSVCPLNELHLEGTIKFGYRTGYGAGMGDDLKYGEFQWTLIDEVQVPEGLAPGAYALSWRWDCEQTPQVWNSCADVTVVA